MANPIIKILLIDDDSVDQMIVRNLLKKIEGTDFDLDWENNYADGLKSLKQQKHDVCLVDYVLGPDNGLKLICEANEAGCELPMIILTGQGDHDVDVEAMEKGVADYLVKDQINRWLLERAIRYAIERHRHLREQKDLVSRLQKALERVEVLSGLLPICASCKKIRDASDQWHSLELYISNHSDATFTHGVCPECTDRLYPMLKKNKG